MGPHKQHQSNSVLLPLLFLLIRMGPIIFFLISPSGAYKLEQRNLLTMDSAELLENVEDDSSNEGTAAAEQIEHIFNAMGGKMDELPIVEWPQGWRRFLLRKFGRALPIRGNKAKAMPCCAEAIGQHVCNELRNRNPLLFRKRCKTDADFAILQCCRSCRTNVAELGRELFATGQKSRHCFDRHNRHFCAHFVHQSGLWAANVGKSVDCNGDGAPLAFRVCRRSCGFCDPELYHHQQQQQNRNCISSVWKMTSRRTTTTTTTETEEVTAENGEHWKSKNGKMTTTPTEQPYTLSKSSSSSKKPTNSASTSSKNPPKATKGTAPPPPSAFPLIVPPISRRPFFTASPLLPCTVPSLPLLPPIPVPSAPWRPSPCVPLEPLAPLNSLTPATIATTTYSAPRQKVTANPFPLLPLPPIEPPRRRSGTTITITWKPSSSGGTWPELPIPLPDEIIEAILNKLSGIDNSGDGNTVGECRECGENARKEKGGQESVGSEESAERREEKEKSEENGEEEQEQAVQQQVEEGVALLLDVLLKAAKWVGENRHESDQNDQQQGDQEEEDGENDQNDHDQRNYQWTDRRTN